MKQGFVLVLVGLTSAAACVVGTRGLGLSWRSLGAALARMFEAIGISVVFFAINLLVAAAAILTARTLGPRFVSLYLADDVTVIALSVLQGLVFQAWRESPRADQPSG